MLLPLVLLAAFFGLVALEFFLPTAGMAGVAAVGCLVAAVYTAYAFEPLAALGVVAAAVAGGPVLIGRLVRVWPRTPIGRMILNRSAEKPATPSPEVMTSAGTPVGDLIGRDGVAKTDLIPHGMVVIDGETVDAISPIAIDRGTPVVVVGVDSRTLRVRPAPRRDRSAVGFDVGGSEATASEATGASPVQDGVSYSPTVLDEFDLTDVASDDDGPSGGG